MLKLLICRGKYYVNCIIQCVLAFLTSGSFCSMYVCAQHTRVQLVRASERQLKSGRVLPAPCTRRVAKHEGIHRHTTNPLGRHAHNPVCIKDKQTLGSVFRHLLVSIHVACKNNSSVFRCCNSTSMYQGVFPLLRDLSHVQAPASLITEPTI